MGFRSDFCSRYSLLVRAFIATRKYQNVLEFFYKMLLYWALLAIKEK